MKNIKFLVMDVDGTLTDGKIYMGAGGEVFKSFDIKDGYGITTILPKAGIVPVVITARKSKIVENRCAELDIPFFFQGQKDKLLCLKNFLCGFNNQNETDYTLADAAYIGDDLPDLVCMEAVKEAGGLCACPSDAVEQVRKVCDFVSTKNGGNGAVRELIEWMMNAVESTCPFIP